MKYTYVTAAFTIDAPGDDFVIQYGGGTDITGVIASTAFIDQADDEYRWFASDVFMADPIAVIDVEAYLNDEVEIINDGTAYTDGGTSTLTVVVDYIVHSY